MKIFIKQIILFFTFFGFIFLIGIFLPTTPRSKNNMLFYKTQKDSLLQNVASPRIIFIGGSNLVFGLNSQMIKDSLQLNPINAGLAIQIGLIYMMDDTLPYIKKGDLVIIAPEYNHFYGNMAYGGSDLFRMLMDVDRAGFLKLRIKQITNIPMSILPYFLSKFQLKSYMYEPEKDVYGKHIFNKYGDSEYHWALKKQDFPLINPIKGRFNYSLINEINIFNNKINEKGAKLMISYPSIQKYSLQVIEKQADKVQKELERADLIILGTPKRYSFSDSLMFNQSYHPSKAGADLRTQYLIEDIKDTLSKYNN